jgi:glycosyltransferase involved in cell wall biosynthesis
MAARGREWVRRGHLLHPGTGRIRDDRHPVGMPRRRGGGVLMTSRIAVVEDAVGPWSKGGRETRYAALLPRLAQRGLDVEVFSMRWWTTPPPGDVRYTAICPLVPMYRGERRSILQAVLFALSVLRLLGRDFDVILADQMPVLHLVPLRVVAWIKRVRLVVQWHEVWGREYWGDYLGGLGAIASSLERLTARLADQVVAGSDVVRQRLEAIGVDAARIVVVPNAVDRSKLDAVHPSDRDVQLVAAGRLIAHKRVDETIRVVARLRERGRSAQLVIIGDGPERPSLMRLVAELGLEGCITFMGTLDTEGDVWSLLKAAAVLVCPSDREGFGLAVAESLALGTPVVCVDHPRNDATRLVDDGITGSVVRPGAIGELVDAVDHWLEVRTSHADLASSFWSLHAGLDWAGPAAILAGLLAES